MTYVPNKWLTYVLTVSLFGNPWQNHNKQVRYERSHKTFNSYSLVEYNKIFPNTNSWKTLQEESLWQVDFDNLYFWNTLNKTHQGIFVWNRNNKFHTRNKKHVHKERKETTHVRGRWQKHTSTYKEDKYNVCQKWSHDPCTRINVSKIEKRKKYN